MEYLNYAKPAAMAPDSILIQHYLVNNSTYFNSVKTNLDKTPPFIEKLSELFGLYPFSDEKYGHAHANIGGGMEHQTMSTMAGFGSTLIAHELGHQWWGDHVTCATWNDIWLNEGFATWAGYLCIDRLLVDYNIWTAFTCHRTSEALCLDALKSTHSIEADVDSPAMIDEMFDDITYSKGACIIRMLSSYIGEEGFQLIEVSGLDRIKLVVVAFRAAERAPEPGRRDGSHPFRPILGEVFLGLGSALARHHVEAIVARGHQLICGRLGEQIPRELFPRKLVEPFVRVERVDHIIPIRPRIRAWLVCFKTIALGKPYHIQPVPGPSLTKMRRAQ
jgi:hypothetical protein